MIDYRGPAGTAAVDRRAGMALAVLLVGQFMANVDVAVVNVAAPAVRAGLGTTGGQLRLVVSGFTLALAALLIVGARLGARYGFGRVFMAGLAAFTLTSMACGLAPSANDLILTRLAQGGAAAVMGPQVLTGITRLFPVTRRSTALGYYAATLSAGAVAGQVLGGVLVSADLFGLGWRPVFLVNVPLGVLCLAAAARLLPRERGDRTQRVDLVGMAMLAASLAAGVVPLVLGADLGWPAWTWWCLAAAAAGLVSFAAVQRRAAARGHRPLVNPAVLARPAVRWGLLSYAAALSTYFGMLFVLALYLQQGLGRSPLYSGMSLVSWVAAFGLAGPATRRLPTWRGRPGGTAATGTALLATAHAAISAATVAHRLTGPLLVALLGLGGFGLGIAATALLAHLTGAVPAGLATDLSGLIPTTAQLSAAVAVAVFGTGYMTLATSSATRAFATVTAVFAAVALAATALAHLATRTTRRNHRYPNGRADAPLRSSTPGMVNADGLLTTSRRLNFDSPTII